MMSKRSKATRENALRQLKDEVLYTFTKEQRETLQMEVAKLQILQQQVKDQTDKLKQLVAMVYPPFAVEEGLGLNLETGVIIRAVPAS